MNADETTTTDLIPKPNRTKPKSDQDAFDRVWNYFVVKGAPMGVKDGTGVYRGPNNQSCATGCLMPDALTNARFESRPIGTLMQERARVRSWFGNTTKGFLASLQTAHDMSISLRELRHRLKGVASSHGLTIPKTGRKRSLVGRPRVKGKR